MPSLKGRTSNSPPKRARSSSTTRRSCWITATVGSPSWHGGWNWTRPTDDRDGLLLHLLGGPADLRRDGGELAQSRALRAVPDPVVLQCGSVVPYLRRRVPRDDPDDRLRGRRRGAVPVRRDDARHRFRRAAWRVPAVSADRRDGGGGAVHRAGAGDQRMEVCSGRADAAAGTDACEREQHGGAGSAALHGLCVPVPGGGATAAGGDDRRDRADVARSQDVAASDHPGADRTHRGGDAGDGHRVDRCWGEGYRDLRAEGDRTGGAGGSGGDAPWALRLASAITWWCRRSCWCWASSAFS